MFRRRRPHKECPKDDAAHQTFLNPKLSRRERRNRDLPDIWIEIDTERDIQSTGVDDGGGNKMPIFNIKKLNGEFHQSPNVGSGLYLFVMTDSHKLRLIKTWNISGLDQFLGCFKSWSPPVWAGAQIMHQDSLPGHSSYFTNERYNQMSAIQERAQPYKPSGSDSFNPMYEQMTSDCDVMFAGEIWYFQDEPEDEWGTLLLWNNGSGHFKPSSDSPNRALTGLPDELYAGADWDPDVYKANGLAKIETWVDFFTDTGSKKLSKKLSSKKKKLLKKSQKKIKPKHYKLNPNNIDKYINSFYGSNRKSGKKNKKKPTKKKSNKKIKRNSAQKSKTRRIRKI